MSAFLLGWFRLIWLFTRGHQALVLENLALPQQLAVYKRHSKRPRLRRSDRMFWIVLAGLWKGWRRALVQVHQIRSFAGSGSVSVGIGHNCPASREGRWDGHRLANRSAV